jgi:rhodanese-related sulfurtransferase/peroxiredoxin
MIGRITNIATWALPAVGEPAHKLSLTADEGTWVKLTDFTEHLNVVFVFFRSLVDTETDAWLQEWSRRIGQFEGLEAVVFGVHTARTDRLRDVRQRLGLEFFLLYDPLAIESRALRCSGRVRPITKDNVVVVGKDGKVLFSERGQVDPATVVATIAAAEGKAVAEVAAMESAATEAADSHTMRKPGAMPDEVNHIDSAKATTLLDQEDGGFLLIDVRTPSEYEADHSPRAVHIPIDELPHRYRELEQTTRIICVCQAGGRSEAAAEFLTSVGCSEIFNVKGGMSAWGGERVTGGQQHA